MRSMGQFDLTIISVHAKPCCPSPHTAGPSAIAVSGGEEAGIFIGGLVLGAGILLAVCLVALVVKRLKEKR